MTALSHWSDTGAGKLNMARIVMTLNDVDRNAIEASIWPLQTGLSRHRAFCLTSDPLNERPIYRYCPDCLSSDPIPHIRKTWRLAFSYVCKQHQSLLKEACPNCGGYINLSKHGEFSKVQAFPHLTIRICQHCGSDLCRTNPGKLNERIYERLLKAQMRMLGILYSFEKRTNQRMRKDHQRQLIKVSYESLMKAMFLIEKRRNQPNFAQRYADIDNFLARFAQEVKEEVSILYAGINGSMLFGQESDQIQALFNERRLFENTFWFPNGTICAKLPRRVIRKANKWLDSGVKNI